MYVIFTSFSLLPIPWYISSRPIVTDWWKKGLLQLHNVSEKRVVGKQPNDGSDVRIVLGHENAGGNNQHIERDDVEETTGRQQKQQSS